MVEVAGLHPLALVLVGRLEPRVEQSARRGLLILDPAASYLTPEDSPDEWTLRTAFPDREATERFQRDEMTRLAAVAQNMRAAIDAVPKAELPETMSGFPAGCCHAASILLGTYLADCGEEGFSIISGERGSRKEGTWTSHAWLARGDLIAHITAGRDIYPHLDRSKSAISSALAQLRSSVPGVLNMRRILSARSRSALLRLP